jgi:DNA polymerase III alpha subunit
METSTELKNDCEDSQAVFLQGDCEAVGDPADGKAYLPLWVKTHFSFLEGASSPEELVDRARDLGLRDLVITDRDGVYGLARAHVHGRKNGVRVIPGAEITVGDTTRILGRVIAIATTREGENTSVPRS